MSPPKKKLKDLVEKNRYYIEKINTKFAEELVKLRRAVIDDNIDRDQNINEIRENLDQLRNFVTKKLSNHPSDFDNFVIHESTQGGRRKTRKRKKRRKSRKMRKKTKRRRKRRRKRKNKRKKSRKKN